MSEKQPVILTVTIETAIHRWFVAGITMTGQTIPLVCSEPGNLQPYVGLEFDEQVSFLRHRLSGVLQRGCDRLWGQMMKPCQIVFLTDGDFVDADQALAQSVADHFVEWMTRPPVVFYRYQHGLAGEPDPQRTLVAGTIDDAVKRGLDDGMPALVQLIGNAECWELIKSKPAV